MVLVGRRWDGGGIGIRCPKSEGNHVLRNRRTPINCKSKQNKQRRLQGIKKISSIEESHERKIRNGITQFGCVVLTPRLRDFSPVRTGRRRVVRDVRALRRFAAIGGAAGRDRRGSGVGHHRPGRAEHAADQPVRVGRLLHRSVSPPPLSVTLTLSQTPLSVTSRSLVTPPPWPQRLIFPLF